MPLYWGAQPSLLVQHRGNLGSGHPPCCTPLQGQGVSLAVVPTRFFYSWGVSIQPPEWRAPKQPPALWQVEPTKLAATGGLPPLSGVVEQPSSAGSAAPMLAGGPPPWGLPWGHTHAQHPRRAPPPAGVDIPLGILSTPRGRLFLSGLASQGKQASLASLPSATLDLGGQLWAWAMFRDETRVAVSLRLASGPNILLWNKMPLPLRWARERRHGWA